METRDWIELILSVLGGLSLLALTCGYAWGQWVQGNNQNKIDNNEIQTSNDDIYKGRIEALELNDRTKSEQIDKLTKEISDLHIAIDERDKKFAAAILTLQGKDPVMSEFIKEQSDFMTYTKLILVRVDKWLNHESF